MRKQVQIQIINLLPTIGEGVKYAINTQSQQAAVVLGDCYAAFNSISDSLKAGLSEERFVFYQNLLIELQSLLEAINNKILDGQPTDDSAEKFENSLQLLAKELTRESEVKIEVVFMPYKSSMWDSLESIWLAARDDDRCNAVVVPIPYYDRNPDHSVAAIHYEGGDFPEYVPIVHYDSFDLSTSLPDIIYIHNPYDDSNLITSVDPRFYSYNLKKFTNMLVYVPYFISGAYADIQTFAQKHVTSCIRSVDKIVVQSDTHKKLYAACGVDEYKLLVLGSPKLDAFISLNKGNEELPKDWVQKLHGKKSIVLNSSIGALLVDPNYLEKLKHRISTIMACKGLVLIWRPHPLLETTITSMRPTMYGEYMEIIRMVKNSENAIIDQSASTIPATIVSDGMISDTSSWARQYIATGKPVLMLKGSSELKKDRICAFDHFSSYFFNDGFSIEEFCDMVLNGTDYKKEARINDLRNSVVNSDGSCGQKINDQVVSLLG